MQPVVAAVTEHCEGKGVVFAKLDVSAPENRHYVDEYRLVGVPTFIFLSADGVEVARLVGKQSQEELFQALSAVRGESCPGVGALPTGKTSPIPQEIQVSTDGSETASCPSTNSSANDAASGSTFSASSPRATTPPLV